MTEITTDAQAVSKDTTNEHTPEEFHTKGAMPDVVDVARISTMIRVLAAWIAAVMVLTFITVPWLRAGSGGDLSPAMIWFYHAIMIPSAILFLLLCLRIFPIHPWARYIVMGGGLVALFSSIGLLVRGYGFLEHSQSIAAIGLFVVIPTDFVLFLVTVVFLAGLAASTIIPRTRASLSRRKIEITWALLLFGISAITWILVGMAYAVSEVGISWNFWAQWQKEPLSTLLGNLVTSHSHGMLPAFMGGIVILAAETFGYSKLVGIRKQIARGGVAVMLAGVALFSGVYFVSALGTYAIPTLFPFGPGAVNGLAMDDTMTGLVGVGALILAGAMLPELRGSLARLGTRVKQRYNPVRIAVYLTYLCAAAAMYFYGYYIEFNESKFGFGSAPASSYMNDQIFTRGHLLFVFGALPVMAVLLLAVEISGNISEIDLRLRKWLSGSIISGMLITLIGLGIWVFSAPGHSATMDAGSAGEVLYVIGQCLMLIGVIIEVFALRSGVAAETESAVVEAGDAVEAALA
jgi:hypothetical protein